MNRLLFFIILLFSNVHFFGQNSIFSKSQKLEFQDANMYFDNDFYHLALPIYTKLYLIDSLNNELNYKLGVCYFNLNHKKMNYLKYFEKSKNDFPKSFFYMGQILHFNEKFDQAIEAYNKYKKSLSVDVINDFIDYNIQKSVYAKEAYANPKNINIKNLGQTINSQHDDYVPLVTADDSIIIFTSRRKSKIDAKTDANNEYYEDIYYSNKIGKSWSDPQNIGKPINTKGHDATVSLSADGKKLFIYRTNRDLAGGDIYESFYSQNKWSKPEKMKGDINCKYCWNSSGSISPDEKTFYFSSNKPGGFGGKDLYKVQKLPTGEWSEAVNLGDKINTIYDEDGPFIHQDGHTLYFSSKGHKNMGGYDVFKSEIDENGNWSEPENLAYPINSAKDDIFFVVAANGKRAYYSSAKSHGYGKNDIYEVEMPENASNYAIISGTITSKNLNEKIEAQISVTDLDKNQIHGIYRTNSVTQKYIIVLLPHRKYLCEIEADGYKSVSYEVDLSDKASFDELYKNIVLEKIKPVE